MTNDGVYEESVSSNRTEALFVALALLFLALFAWRAVAGGPGWLIIPSFLLFTCFLFYSLNYRTLRIRVTGETLELRFGIFKWAIPLDGIESCHLDDTSLWRISGAGIHFSRIRGKYRAMFNFLEHPRVVVVLTQRRGLVRAAAFSTMRPEEVMGLLVEAASRGNEPTLP